jgi:cytochrome c oxidase cbb3-type subunit 3
MADDPLLGHDFDGIREYDNPTPGWWHMIFWATVVFGVVYFYFFHMGSFGWTLDDAYQSAVAGNAKVRFAKVGELTADEPTLLKAMTQPEWMAMAATTFSTNCKSCHAADGSGLVGPNLTDDHYKNVKKLMDIVKVVSEGAATGSMPAWRNRLVSNEIILVSAYVASLRGKNLPGPRAAEGEVIPPWPNPFMQPATPQAAGPGTKP